MLKKHYVFNFHSSNIIYHRSRKFKAPLGINRSKLTDGLTLYTHYFKGWSGCQNPTSNNRRIMDKVMWACSEGQGRGGGHWPCSNLLSTLTCQREQEMRSSAHPRIKDSWSWLWQLVSATESLHFEIPLLLCQSDKFELKQNKMARTPKYLDSCLDIF